MILVCLYILCAIGVCTIYTYIYKSTIFICIEISKVLNKVAKEKGCEALLPWIKPCVNHLYWSATSTVDGNGAVIWAKFASFFEHIVNVHSNLSNPVFNKCAHGDDITERTWLLKGEVFVFLQ